MRSSPNLVHKRERLYTKIVVTFLVCFAIVCGITSHGSMSTIHGQKRVHTHYSPPGTLDGSVDPAAIRDNKAYSLLFRFLSKRYDEREKRLARTFIKAMGVRDADISVLISASEQFDQLVGQLDHQAREIRQRSRLKPTSEVISELALLDGQKDKIITRMVSSLSERLHKDSLENLREYVSDRFKRRMKVVPAASN
jgi:hypothetical protein